MRLPGETVEELEREDRVWELLKPWAGPDDIELVRHKIYNFRSLLAEKWHDRRLLIAGDAAHVMPPFMGQGMCSGMRDAWNLAWKLGFILDGKASDQLLDTYQPERLPHVSQIIDMSIYLGKIICIPDPVEAKARDEAFLGGTAEPPPPFPCLSDGLLHRDTSGTPTMGAGLLAPHVDVSVNGQKLRLDEIASGAFLLITGGYRAPEVLTQVTADALASIDTGYVQLGGLDGIEDLDGRLTDFLTERQWTAMIVRPDFYVYGGAATAEDLQQLVNALIADLAGAGVVFVTKKQSRSKLREASTV